MVWRAGSGVFGAGLVALTVAGGTAAIHGRNGVALGPPPAVAVKPVTDVVGGHSITDNYRWLEDQNSPETREFLRAQMEYTDGYFSQLARTAGAYHQAADGTEPRGPDRHAAAA